ncbi:MAG: GumC family protein [Polyangia bacterium]
MTGPFSPRDQMIAFTTLVSRVLRARKVGAVAMGFGLGATVILALSTHRLYRSEAVLVYERGAQAVGATEGTSARGLASRVGDMMLSRERLEGLVKEMNLYPGIVDRRAVVDAADELRRHLKITAREEATLEVSYDGDSRDLAKNVLDRLISGVIDADARRRTHEAEDAVKFLQNERRQADDELKKKEGALSAFLSTHPQLAGEVGSATSGGLIRAADRDRASAAGGDVAGLELQAAQIEESLNTIAPSLVAGQATGDPSMLAAQARADAELQAARTDLAEKQAHFTNEHPDVKMAMRRVTMAEAAVRHAEAAAIASRKMPVVAPAAGTTASSDAIRIGALKRALAAVHQQIAAAHGRSAPRAEMPKSSGSMVAIDTEWTRLNRDVVEASERQTQLQTRQFQAELTLMLTQAGEGPRLVVADRPYRPTGPIAGGRFKITLAGLAGSVLLTLLAMGVSSAFDDHLYAPSDLARVMVDDCIVVVIPTTPPQLPPKSSDDQNNDQVGNELASG